MMYVLQLLSFHQAQIVVRKDMYMHEVHANKIFSRVNTVTASLDTADLCTLRVNGAYPSLEVVDIQGVGVANDLSKATLWTMLNIDK